MYLWRRTAEVHWVEAHEGLLQAHAGGQLVIVRRPERKRLELEIACRSQSDSSALLKEFGGRMEPLGRNWLERVRRSFSEGGPPQSLQAIESSCVSVAQKSRTALG